MTSEGQGVVESREARIGLERSGKVSELFGSIHGFLESRYDSGVEEVIIRGSVLDGVGGLVELGSGSFGGLGVLGHPYDTLAVAACALGIYHWGANYAAWPGTPNKLTQVTDASKCAANANAWYYDDNAKPTKIILCPTTCTDLNAKAGSKIEALVGCAAPPPK